MVLKINIPLALLYFMQIPLQYFGFQKLLNGKKSRLSQYSYELQSISAKNNKNIKAVISDVNSIKKYCDSEVFQVSIDSLLGYEKSYKNLDKKTDDIKVLLAKEE